MKHNRNYSYSGRDHKEMFPIWSNRVLRRWKRLRFYLFRARWGERSIDGLSLERLARKNRLKTWSHATPKILEWWTVSVRIQTTSNLSFQRTLLILVLAILNEDRYFFSLQLASSQMFHSPERSWCSWHGNTNTSSGVADLFSRCEEERRKVRKRESRRRTSKRCVENIRKLGWESRKGEWKRVPPRNKIPDSCYSGRQNSFFTCIIFSPRDLG